MGIESFRAAVVRAGAAAPSRSPNADQLAVLPQPVQRWVEFTFCGPVRRIERVEVHMHGQFRRPGANTFEPTARARA